MKKRKKAPSARKLQQELKALRKDYERLLANFTVAQEENNRLHSIGPAQNWYFSGASKV
jgi:hypothetical protein